MADIDKEKIKHTLVENLLSDERFDVDKVTQEIAEVAIKPPGPPVSYCDRSYWKMEWVYDTYDHDSDHEIPTKSDLANAKLIGSKCGSGDHAPLFDIDYSANLIPSSTPGHFHLYLNKEISWRKYKRVLRAMKNAGLIEQKWYLLARQRKNAMLRLPMEKKQLTSTGKEVKTTSNIFKGVYFTSANAYYQAKRRKVGGY